MATGLARNLLTELEKMNDLRCTFSEFSPTLVRSLFEEILDKASNGEQPTIPITAEEWGLGSVQYSGAEHAAQRLAEQAETCVALVHQVEPRSPAKSILEMWLYMYRVRRDENGNG